VLSLSRPLRSLTRYSRLLPYPWNLVALLAALLAVGYVWWQLTGGYRERPGKPYGRVIPYQWHERGAPMIFITAKFRVLPEQADRWMEIAGDFTRATRAEPGCLWFDWSRSVEDPTEYVLVEAFRDGAAGAAHVQSPHFRAAQSELPQHLVETPRVISQSLDQDDWSELGEMKVVAPGA
jgi:quinol monooxygenase YgiN